MSDDYLVEVEESTRPFVMTPVILQRYFQLVPRDLAVWVALRDYANNKTDEAWMFRENLAKLARVSRATVFTALTSLEHLELIVRWFDPNRHKYIIRIRDPWAVYDELEGIAPPDIPRPEDLPDVPEQEVDNAGGDESRVQNLDSTSMSRVQNLDSVSISKKKEQELKKLAPPPRAGRVTRANIRAAPRPVEPVPEPIEHPLHQALALMVARHLKPSRKLVFTKNQWDRFSEQREYAIRQSDGTIRIERHPPPVELYARNPQYLQWAEFMIAKLAQKGGGKVTNDRLSRALTMYDSYYPDSWLEWAKKHSGPEIQLSFEEDDS